MSNKLLEIINKQSDRIEELEEQVNSLCDMLDSEFKSRDDKIKGIAKILINLQKKLDKQ